MVTLHVLVIQSHFCYYYNTRPYKKVYSLYQNLKKPHFSNLQVGRAIHYIYYIIFFLICQEGIFNFALKKPSSQ